jgi:hypothetical protein
LSALHVVDCLSEHGLGIKQARILLVMHLTGANSARKVQAKTLLDSDHVRGVLCHLRMKHMLEQATGGSFPTYQLTPKAHAFINGIVQ